MSYSRWSQSIWYVYADVGGGLTVCGEKNFSDIELKDIDKCLSFFKDKDYSQEELSELRGYMEQFIKDGGTRCKMENHSD